MNYGDPGAAFTATRQRMVCRHYNPEGTGGRFPCEPGVRGLTWFGLGRYDQLFAQAASAVCRPATTFGGRPGWPPRGVSQS